jgi:hypothetical protein
MPNRYLAQQEKVPRRRHAPGALPGGATGGGGGRELVVLWRLGLGAGGAESLSSPVRFSKIYDSDDIRGPSCRRRRLLRLILRVHKRYKLYQVRNCLAAN